MDKIAKERVSNLLGEASRLLSSSSSSSAAVQQNEATRDNGSRLQETLFRARGMVEQSSSEGVFKRLNRQERLRSTAPYASKSSKPANTKETKKKPFEFSLLRCFDEDEEEPYNLRWDSVIASGIILLDETDNEEAIRRAIQSSLQNKYPIIGVNDFDFVKVKRKTVITLEMGEGIAYDYAIIKKMAGQGSLYVKVKQGYEFLYEETKETSRGAGSVSTKELETDSDNADLMKPVFEIASEPIIVDSEDAADERKCQDVEVTSDSDSSNSLITDINEQELTDRVEILRFLQKRIIRGRELDIKCLSDTTEGGETNFICVNRDDILNTTFSELKDIQDYCITFEVDFVGEIAKDLGGPRKEWIRLMNQAMKEKYFDKGLRPYLVDDYYYVGIMIGIALLQNGQLPSFMPVDIVEQLEIPNTNPCIANLQKGMDVFGLAKIIYKVPILLHLLRPSPRGIVAKHVIHLLKPKFSEAGSSMFLREKEVYSLFIKYIREVSSGRREPITLSSLLVFTTGASEEPVLGFAIQPSIEFAALSDTQPPTEDESSQLCAGDMLGTCGQNASPQVSKEFPHVLVFTALGAGEACSNRPSR